MEKKTQKEPQKKPISFDIRSECAESNQSIHIEIDSELNYRVVNEDADLRIYIPVIDFAKLKEPSIVDVF